MTKHRDRSRKVCHGLIRIIGIFPENMRTNCSTKTSIFDETFCPKFLLFLILEKFAVKDVPNFVPKIR